MKLIQDENTTDLFGAVICGELNCIACFTYCPLQDEKTFKAKKGCKGFLEDLECQKRDPYIDLIKLITTPLMWTLCLQEKPQSQTVLKSGKKTDAKMFSTDRRITRFIENLPGLILVLVGLVVVRP